MKLLSLVLLWVLAVCTVHADEYQKPDTIPCTATPAGLLFCVDTNRPAQETVQQELPDGSKQLKVISTNTAVQCATGVCRSLNGEYYGNLPGRVSALVNHDYYLAVSPDNQPWSYRRGTGPAWSGADPGTVIPPISKTYEIECSKDHDQPCKTDQGLMMIRQLPKHYPYYQEAATDVVCSEALCKNIDGRVVGLNPAYNEYAK